MGIKFRFFSTPTGRQVAVGISIIGIITSFFAGAIWQRSATTRLNITPTPSLLVETDHSPLSSQKPTLILPSMPTLLPSPTAIITASSSSTSTPTTISTLHPTFVDKGTVLINEIAWAGTTASSYDEWIELYNPGTEFINLTGWRLTTDESEIDIHLIGYIYPGGYYLLERTNDDTISDISANLIYRGGLNNTGGRLWLYDSTGKIVDSANENGGAWPAGDSVSRASMERRGLQPDTDDSWRTNTGHPINGHDCAGNPIVGTPTKTNSLKFDPPTPAQSSTATFTSSTTPTDERIVLINEVAWAGTTASNFDEWLELFNPSRAEINLTGWRLAAKDGSPNILLSGSISAGGYYLLERTDDDTLVDIAADFIYTGSLSNTGEILRLLDPSGKIIDTANNTGGTWPAGDSTSHASMERKNNQSDSPSAWGTNTGFVVNGHDTAGNGVNGTPKQPNSLLFPTSTLTYTPGPTQILSPTAYSTSTFTPSPTKTSTISITATVTSTPTSTNSYTPMVTGTLIPTPTATAILGNQLVLNEILADPANGTSGDANGDGTRNYTQDEFIEIFNTSSADIDISNWMLVDSDAIRHIFPEGTVVSAQCAVIIFGGGTPTGTFGSTLIQKASSGALDLNNAGGDTVVLYDSSSNLVLIYIYGNEGNDNQSITRSPDISGNDPLVKHSTVSEGLFSPGTLTDGSIFPGCHP